jgi:hypothetical protein
MILSILSVFIFFFLFVFIPGRVVSLITKLPDWLDLQLIIGLAILPLVLFFGRFILPVNALLVFYLFTILLISQKNKLTLRLPMINKMAIFFILIGVIAQSLPYLKTATGLDQLLLAIADNHDQAWHLSLIHELILNFPPQVPGFSGQILKNYHYFYDLIISANVSLFKAKPEVLLQLVYPVVFSALFGISVWRFLTQLTKNKTILSLGILLAYFGNNISFTSSNFFLIDQPLFFIFNHQTVLSIAILLYLLILFSLQLEKPTKYLGILIGTLLAGLSFLKIYAFLCLGLVLLFLSIRHFKKLIPIFITAGLLVGSVLFLSFQPSSPMLTIKPFWIISAFTDKIILPQLPQLFARSHRFWYLPVATLLIIVFNYHLNLFSLLIKKRSVLVNLLILTFFSSLALFFTIFQTSSPYNIIQFVPYATTTLAILAVAFASKLKPKLGLTYLSIILLLSLPTSLKTVYAFANTQDDLPPLQQELVETITPLKSMPRGITLSLVDRDYHVIPDPLRPLNFIGNNLIGSIGQKQAYFADQKQLEVLNINYRSRLEEINQLKQSFCQDKSLLIKANINYLILADDLTHCAGDDQIIFTKIHQTQHFSLFNLQVNLQVNLQGVSSQVD